MLVILGGTKHVSVILGGTKHVFVILGGTKHVLVILGGTKHVLVILGGTKQDVGVHTDIDDYNYTKTATSAVNIYQR